MWGYCRPKHNKPATTLLTTLRYPYKMLVAPSSPSSIASSDTDYNEIQDQFILLLCLMGDAECLADESRGIVPLLDPEDPATYPKICKMMFHLHKVLNDDQPWSDVEEYITSLELPGLLPALHEIRDGVVHSKDEYSEVIHEIGEDMLQDYFNSLL